MSRPTSRRRSRRRRVRTPRSMSLGQQIYRGGIPSRGIPACIACHGPTGHGNPFAAYPANRLAACGLRHEDAAGIQIGRARLRRREPDDAQRRVTAEGRRDPRARELRPRARLGSTAARTHAMGLRSFLILTALALASCGGGNPPATKSEPPAPEDIAAGNTVPDEVEPPSAEPAAAPAPAPAASNEVIAAADLGALPTRQALQPLVADAADELAARQGRGRGDLLVRLPTLLCARSGS